MENLTEAIVAATVYDVPHQSTQRAESLGLGGLRVYASRHRQHLQQGQGRLADHRSRVLVLLLLGI